MKMSKLVLLSASLWAAVFLSSGNALAAGSGTADIDKKPPESSVMADDSGMKELVVEGMESSMKPEAGESMKAGMADAMDKQMEEPMKSGMEATMKTEMEEPMKTGMGVGMKEAVVKPTNSEKK